LATTKSHRQALDSELVRFGTNVYYLSGRVNKESTYETIEIGYSALLKKKVAKVSGRAVNKLGAIIGNLNIVLFSPEELDLIKRGPAARRRFMDIFLSQIDKVYLANLQQYQKVLAHRNECLRKLNIGAGSYSVLDAYDEQFIDLAVRMGKRRSVALSKMGQLFINHSKVLNLDKEKLSFHYVNSFGDREGNEKDIQQIATKIKENRAHEIRRGTSLAGPHRDDISFLINGRGAAAYASQGQQRTAILSLKLAEMDYMKSVTGEYPVLLLDDVLSELDESRRSALFLILKGKLQSIITGTDLEIMAEAFDKEKMNVLRIRQGKVTQLRCDKGC
ncbi:MAG: DNA replication/repair protein RecF, partial [bacterium]|nr:DNA replication/repair protein RecF [bacterium]